MPAGLRERATSSGPHEPDIGLVIGIAVAAAVLLFVILSVVFVSCLHSRQKRQLEALNAEARQRRLSGYPGGHLSIDGETAETVQRPREALRRSTYSVYGSPAGWGVLSSRENIHDGPLLAGISRSLAPWRSPKLHRPRRPQGIPPKPSSRIGFRKGSLGLAVPLKKFRGSPLSAITESPRTQATGSPKMNTLFELPASLPSSPSQSPDSLCNGQPGPAIRAAKAEDFRHEELKPEPLFGSRHHDSTQKHKSMPAALDEPKQHRAIPRPIQQQRPLSLGGQQSREVSRESVPTLSRYTSLSINGSNVPRSSYTSVSSAETVGSSIIHLRGSRPISELEPEPISIDLTSLLPPSADRNYSNRHESKTDMWRSPSVTGMRPPIGRSWMRSLHNQRLRGSVRGTLNDKNLQRASSERIASGNSQPSFVSLNRTASEHSHDGNLNSVRNIYSPISSSPFRSRDPSASASPLVSTEDRSSQSPFSATRVSQLGSPSAGRRANRSAIPLRSVSGNQSNPSPSRASSVRSSVAEGNPFHWDTVTLQTGKPSALKGSPRARKGHKRQNCVRISVQAPTVLGLGSSRPCTPMLEEEPGSDMESPPQKQQQRSARSNPSLMGPRLLPRPPSVSTFNPQIKNHQALSTPRRSIERNFGDDSPTFAEHNIYHSPGSYLDESSTPRDDEEDPFGPSTNGSSPGGHCYRNHNHGSNIFAQAFSPSSFETVATTTSPTPTSPSLFGFATPAHATAPAPLKFQTLSDLKEPSTPSTIASSLLLSPRSGPPPPSQDVLASAPAWSPEQRPGAQAKTQASKAVSTGISTTQKKEIIAPSDALSALPPSRHREIQKKEEEDRTEAVRASVLALRRMNSDVSIFGSEKSILYLNMGASSTSVNNENEDPSPLSSAATARDQSPRPTKMLRLDGGDAVGVGGGGKRGSLKVDARSRDRKVQGPKGPRTPSQSPLRKIQGASSPVRGSVRGTPGSLYDQDGFLK
ncbi:MAG: hypothetical protein M1819_005728 [Sarea resinae]|nr:MAG: hypothetical protein M1819_005728 [Sarea resinae]